MHTDLTVALPVMWSFLLILARISGVLVAVPIPGFSAGPDVSRALLAGALTVVLFPAGPALAPNTPTVAVLLGQIASETAFGLTIGLAIAFLLEGVQLAAQIIGLQAGYSFASTIDPATQADSTTLQVIAQLFAGSLFFAFGLDRQVVRALVQSFQSIPAGGYVIDRPIAEVVVRLGAGIFSTGLRLALPVLALTILLDIAFAVLGRLHAQLQLLSLAFAVKMLVALVFLASVLPRYSSVFQSSAAVTFSTLARLWSH